MANRVALVRLLPYPWRMPTKDTGKPESLPVPPTCFRSLLLYFVDRHLLGIADHDLGPALQRLRSPAVLFQLADRRRQRGFVGCVDRDRFGRVLRRAHETDRRHTDRQRHNGPPHRTPSFTVLSSINTTTFSNRRASADTLISSVFAVEET